MLLLLFSQNNESAIETLYLKDISAESVNTIEYSDGRVAPDEEIVSVQQIIGTIKT